MLEPYYARDGLEAMEGFLSIYMYVDVSVPDQAGDRYSFALSPSLESLSCFVAAIPHPH